MMTGKNVLTVRSLIILVPIIFTGLYIGKQYHSDYNMYMDMQKYLPGRNEVPMGPVVNDGGDCYNTFIALQSDQNNIPFGRYLFNLSSCSVYSQFKWIFLESH